MPPVLSLPDWALDGIRKAMARAPFKGLGLAPDELERLDWRARIRLATTTWAREGAGLPAAVNGYYLLKSLLYLLGFKACLGRGSLLSLLATPKQRQNAFCRFVVYNLLFEVLNFGCASGPLSARFVPPHSSWFYWLCPGTLKLPLRANGRDSRRPLLPWLGCKRGAADLLLFAGYLASMLRALLAREVTPALCRPICGFLAALAFTDHTVFLASRGEVYGYMLAAQAAGGSLAAMQCVQLAIYAWAAVSKLGPWFTPVIQVMLSNSPSFPSFLKPRLYRDFEKQDLRPSNLAVALAKLGTGMELAIPSLLPWGGRCAQAGMFLSLSMHGFIFANFALGVPQEWNIFTPISVLHLFLTASDGLDVRGLRVLVQRKPLFAAFLAFVLVALPSIGTIYPPSNSFLTSMKYYAGNWPNHMWLLKRSALWKLERLRTMVELLPLTYDKLFSESLSDQILLQICAFRAIHLPSRCLPDLVERALQGKRVQDYRLVEGETMGTHATGYNFGDGYLNGRFLCQAIQDVCHFEKGEVILIGIDSCPGHCNAVPWYIRDATALWDDKEAVALGVADVAEMVEKQPY